MPPRLSRVAIDQSRLIRLQVSVQQQQLCPICSFSGRVPKEAARARPYFNQHQIRARKQSTITSTEPPRKEIQTFSRQKLREALVDLQKHAAAYINISRLQLALRGLDQSPGQETIRIAILGQADGGASLKKAKQLLRLLVADPLKAEEEWERILVKGHAGSKPTILKVSHDGAEDSTHGSGMLQQLHVSSPTLNGHNLEILLLEMDPQRDVDQGAFTEALLVPTMEIPTSSTGRYTPVTTPVHKSLIVAQGIRGAASVLAYPSDLDPDLIGTTVDLVIGASEVASLPFPVIDVTLGFAALETFRQSLDNALIYEQNWFTSGVPGILEWIKSGTAPTEGQTKEPLRKLIESVIFNATTLIEAEKVRQLNMALSAKVSPKELDCLRLGLAEWAERAHTELRDQLDIAFEGRRWRKLGWWKLFWRVDDVSMIASDILGQRFLPDAEKEIIYQAGCISQAGVLNEIPARSPKDWAYKPVQEEISTSGLAPPPPTVQDLVEAPTDILPVKLQPRPWPLHIPATRLYLLQETVPALQALAQKLLLQTISASTLSTIFGGLVYLSSVSNGLYEAGGVAALGIVFSLRRMQGKWEAARQYWEGEVREEGRKAVRQVEGVVSEVLNAPDRPLEVDPEFEKAKEAVNKARDAFETFQ